jgi:DNA-binding transcriptional LysR family regulator
MDKFANLQAFVSVVESGSFSAAANRLTTDKSIISRRVGALETSLGVQLLQRTTRRLSLTSAGQSFYEHAVRILSDLEDAEQAIGEQAGQLGGRVRIAGPLSFGLHHLSTVLAGFIEQHPGIELDVDLNDREVNLVEEGLDMTVRIGNLADSNLLSRRIGLARFVTCASPAYLAGAGMPEHPQDLRGHTGMQYSNLADSQAWRFAVDGDPGRVCIPDIRVRINNGDALADMAVAGRGIVYLPSFIVSDRIADGSLVAILETYRRAPVGIHAVFPPGRLMPRRIRVLIDHLAASFGDRPEWDQVIGLVD